jgi:chemotaxis protein MotB
VRSHRAAALLVASASLASLASSGCIVLKKDYDQCVTDAAGYRAAAETKQKEDAAALLSLQERLTAAESATQDRDTKLADLSTATHNLQAQLDEATAINQQLRGELQRLGKDVDKILADKGTLSKALDDAKARLDELRKAQAAAEARTMLFKDFGQRFKALVDAGQLRIETRRGQLVLEVTGDLLFDAGHAEVRTAGKGVLMEIARALQTASSPARRFLVTDHAGRAGRVAHGGGLGLGGSARRQRLSGRPREEPAARDRPLSGSGRSAGDALSESSVSASAAAPTAAPRRPRC